METPQEIDLNSLSLEQLAQVKIDVALQLANTQVKAMALTNGIAKIDYIIQKKAEAQENASGYSLQSSAYETKLNLPKLKKIELPARPA